MAREGVVTAESDTPGMELLVDKGRGPKNRRSALVLRGWDLEGMRALGTGDGDGSEGDKGTAGDRESQGAEPGRAQQPREGVAKPSSFLGGTSLLQEQAGKIQGPAAGTRHPEFPPESGMFLWPRGGGEGARPLPASGRAVPGGTESSLCTRSTPAATNPRTHAPVPPAGTALPAHGVFGVPVNRNPTNTLGTAPLEPGVPSPGLGGSRRLVGLSSWGKNQARTQPGGESRPFPGFPGPSDLGIGKHSAIGASSSP